MRRIRATLGLVAVSVAAMILVTGCGAGQTLTEPVGVDRERLQVPDFQGAWSDWFTRIYIAEGTTDRQREVLSDGVIDDQEYVALRSEFRKCLEDLGVAVTLNADGGFSVATDGNLSETQITGDAVPTCESESVGAVASLYESIRRNPDQQNELSIMVDCLKRHGAVGDAYTEAQYVEDLDGWTGLDWSSKAVLDCSQDPLGILDDDPITPRP